jgi:hypothetical protein
MSASPFETLVRADRIVNVDGIDWGPCGEKKVTISGFGWNTDLHLAQVAMVHRYVWMESCSFHGAPNTNKVGEIARALGDPRLIISGDNHIGFWHSKTRTFNCGSLMRLNRDQANYRPRVGIVYSDFSIMPYYLDTMNDNSINVSDIPDLADKADKEEQLDDFLHELRQMGRGGLDYLDAVRRYTIKNGVKKATTRLIESILTGE